MRCLTGHSRTALDLAGDFGWHFHLVQVRQGLVHSFVVLVDHAFAALAIGLLDGVFDLRDRFFTWQHTGYGKKAGLHDGVDAVAHAGLFSHIIGVDGVELQLLFYDGGLRFARQVVPDLFRSVDAVEQENAARLGIFENVKAFQEVELVACHEVGCVGSDQVRRQDWLGTKAQVADRQRAGFLGIVNKVTACIVFGFFTDDLDRVLVGAHGSIRTQPDKYTAHGFRVFDRKGPIKFQAGVGDIVIDADREVILGLGLL